MPFILCSKHAQSPAARAVDGADAGLGALGSASLLPMMRQPAPDVVQGLTLHGLFLTSGGERFVCLHSGLNSLVEHVRVGSVVKAFDGAGASEVIEGAGYHFFFYVILHRPR